MILEERNGVVGSEDPVVEGSFGPAPAGNPSSRRRAGGETSALVGTGLWPVRSKTPHLHSCGALQQGSRRSIQHFLWPESFKFFLNEIGRSSCRESV